MGRRKLGAKAGLRSLQDICQVFEEGGIRHWLDSGTLLGVVREGRILPWDTDIDIGVWAEDFPRIKRLWPRFRELGYRPWPPYTGPPHQMELRGGGLPVHIDGFIRHGHEARSLVLAKRRPRLVPLHACVFAARTAVGVLWMVDRWPWRKVIRAYHRSVPYDLLMQTEVHETGLRIPHKSQEYLQYRYGPDWQVPKKDWRNRQDGAWRKELPSEMDRKRPTDPKEPAPDTSHDLERTS